MAFAEVCTLWVIFGVSQVAWPETSKLCYDGISVWICPPPLSDLKLWWTAKIRSCWTNQHHLPKFGSITQILPLRVDFCLTTLRVPIVLVPYIEWDPIVTGILTHAHDHKPDHVNNKVVTKEINMIKWWGRKPSAEICTLSVLWPEIFKLCCDGISVWICPPPLSDLKLWRTAKFHRYSSDQHHLPKFVSITQILPSRVDFCFTTLRVPIVLVPYMEWDPIVTGTLTHAHDHKPFHVHNEVVSKQINMI